MEETKLVSEADEGRQELDSENVPDEMDGEQTWPTEEEMQAADIAAAPAVRKMARVPKGMSDYQASWIAEEGEEESDDEEGDDEDDENMEDFEEDEEEDQEEDGDNETDAMTETMTEAGDDDYDAKHVNFAAEVDELEAIKKAREECEFPDEVDTPMDVAARIRFQKYRGLKVFKSSVWDPKENLPLDYARIFQFENFDRTKKRVMGETVRGPRWEPMSPST